MAIATEELVMAGLCDESEEHHLTAKGRDWLQALELVRTRDIVELDMAEDLVLSTSGLYR
ncbi:MAG TPA: hypothetical protein VJ927_11260 [Actinomycetota bacterium]|nr:hypothetical protein [Actinomycetota bacterium]